MKNLIYLLILLGFVACKKESDPCKSVTCYNDGICLDGDCQCPPQWTGINCKEEVPPKKTYITSITLTRYIENYPDLFLYVISDLGQRVRVTETQVDSSPPAVTTFTFNPPLENKGQGFFVGNDDLPFDDSNYQDYFICESYKPGTDFLPIHYFDGLFGEVSGRCESIFEW